MPKRKYSKTYLGVAYSLLLVTPKVLEDYIDRRRGGFICTIRNFKEPFKEKLDQEQLKLVEELIALPENNLCRYYDQIKRDTVLDKLFLDILISKLVMTKEDREEVSKHSRQSDRNKAILEILIRKPKYKWKDFLKALKDSEETNYTLASQLEQQAMLKESQLEQHDMLKESQIGKPLTDICKYTTKVQKNYDKLVTQIQSTALEAIIDKLIEQNVVSSDDREEIKMCKSTSDMIRLLLQKINNESQSMTFVQALRADEVYNSLADAIESTEITEEDIRSIKQACPYTQYKSSFDASTTITLLSIIFEAEIPVTTPLREDVSFGADLYRLKSYITDIINKDDIDDDTMTKIFLDITKILVRLGGPDIEHNLVTDLVNVEQKLIATLTQLKEMFTKELFDVKVIEGCNADFEIWTKQNTVCTKWFKDGSEISNSDRFQIHSSNCGKIHSLKICNTDLSDKGVYTVRVQDVERRARLEVIEYFTKTTNMNIECTEGENADLSFEVLDGYVSVVWKKGGYELKNSKKYEINDHGKTHSLSIKKTELDDAGNYLIQVNNRTRMTVLFIKEYFSINLKNMECLEGDDICFECEILDENMIARWFKDDDEVETSTKYKMQSQGRRHQIYIINARLTDAGEYCALLKNCKRKCSLTVREKSKNILSEKDKSLFLNIIKSKQETRFYIRIIIIGENGVGKTCLVRRLLKLGTDNVKSTDGIDIYRCRIQDGKWVYDKGTDKRKQLITRMKQSINVQSLKHDYPVKDKDIERKGAQDSPYNNQNKTQPIDSPNSSTHSQMDSPNISTHSQMDSSDRSTNSQMDSSNISTNSQMESSKSDYQTTADNLNAEIRQSELENKTIVEEEEANTEQAESPKSDIIDSVLNDNIVQELSIFLDDIENSEVADEVLVDCGFWDFAGQREYYPTHPIFLNPHALHLLVANITKDIEPIKAEKGFNQIGEYLDFWFDSVHSLMDAETDDNEKFNPPVILVCTNIDKCNDIGDVNKLEERTETFRKQVITILGDEKRKHLRHFCRISNTESTEEEFDDLRKLIFEFGKEMKTFGEKLPLKFIRLERALDIVRETGVNILSWGDIKTLAYKCSFYTENEIKLFLKYQHTIGNIIYFERLTEMIILNQKWLADAFKCLVSVRFDEALKLSPAWKRLEETGELSENLIEKLLQKESKLDLNKNRQHILEVMEMFGIIFKVKTKSPNGDKQASPTYYMPSMITSQFSIEDIKREFCASDECTQSPWLCIEFTFMPLDVFNNIMREFISRYSVCTVSRTNQKAIYHGLGVFDLDEFYKLAVYFSKNTIALQIWQWAPIEQTKYKEIVDKLRTWIFKYQTKYETRHLTYIVKTKCRDGDIHNLGGRKSYKDLFGKEKFICEDHRKTHNSKDFMETWFHNYSEAPIDHDVQKLDQDYLLPGIVEAEEFKSLFKLGTYESFENRIYLAGACSVGKSTLASLLIGDEIPLEWKSTDGLQIFFGRTGIHLDERKMVPLKKGYQNILSNVLRGQPGMDKRQPDVENLKPEGFSMAKSAHNDNYKQQAKSASTSMESAKREPQAPQSKSNTHEKQQIVNEQIKQQEGKSMHKLQGFGFSLIRENIKTELKRGEYRIKIAPSDLVDFGGKRSYDMTHQIFIQGKGTFTLLFDGRKGLHDPLPEYPQGDVTTQSILKHWVDSILTYCGEDDDDILPVILFVATHRDTLKEDEQLKRKKEFQQGLKEMFQDHQRKSRIWCDNIFFVNGRDKDDSEVNRLQTTYVDIAFKQKSWGKRMPMAWVPLELQMSEMRSNNISIVSKDDLKMINENNDDFALTESQLDEFLRVQHSMGKILYFERQGLENYIIVQPTTLVDILRSFITDKMFWPKDKALQGIHKAMTETGKIRKEDLFKLWSQEEFDQHMPDKNQKMFVAQTLMYLDFLVEPKCDHTTESVSDFYLVPCMVTRQLTVFEQHLQKEKAICLSYLLKSTVPSALSFKLICAALNVWPLKETNKGVCLYHKAAILCIDKSNELHILVKEDRVIVYLQNAQYRHNISPDIASCAQECITHTLRAALEFYHNSFGKIISKSKLEDLFELRVGENCDSETCYISLSEAQNTPFWICQFGKKHETKYPLYWAYKKEKECQEGCTSLDTECLKSSPTDKHLARLANLIDIETFADFIIHLGLKKRTWKNIECKYRGDAINMQLEAFRELDRTGERPSFEDLNNALTKCEYDSHILCEVFREDTTVLEMDNPKLQNIPDEGTLKAPSKTIGNCAFSLGVELDVDIVEIESTIYEFKKDMFGQNFDILKKWQKMSGGSKTIRTLMHVLWIIDRRGFNFLKKTYQIV